MPTRDLRGRVVVITGAAGGLGRALAARFAERGARLGLLDLEQAAVDRAAVGLPTETLALACDVTSADACARAVAAVVERFGGVDVLVNNAGITHRSAFADTDVEVYRRVMEVSYFGAIHCTKAAFASLVERRGLIVAMSSVAGFAPVLGRTGYAGAKHAMIGLFSSLRAELRPSGVGVLVVTPAFIRTNIDVNALDGDGEKTVHPQSTVGEVMPAEVAAAAIVRACERNRERLLLSFVARVARLLSALAPRFYERIMVRSLRSELQRDT